MARENEGYRDTLEAIRATFDHAMLTVSEAAQITGYSPKRVTQVYKQGWVGQAKGKRIADTTLARLMSMK